MKTKRVFPLTLAVLPCAAFIGLGLPASVLALTDQEKEAAKADI